jgi:hypothetical protein
MYNIPSWSQVNNPYHYQYKDSYNKLLITVGDSWTYGDSLGNTKVREGRDDTAYRQANIYGNILSDIIQHDWVNLALPGISNSLMLEWIDQYLTGPTSYKETVCVITLTESGRHEDLRLLNSSLTTQQQALKHILTHTYGQITFLRLKHPHVKFLVAHNFTDSIDNSTVNKSWLEVILNRQIQNGTHIVVSEHIKQMNYDVRFPDVLDIMERASARMDLLDNCNHCFKEDSRHPNESGHKMWADYLATQI